MHFINKNKMVLDIFEETEINSKKLVEYWDKNFEVDWQKLRENYKDTQFN